MISGILIASKMLFEAIEKGEQNLVESIVSKGEDLESKDKCGNTPRN
jgi:hypothetical protein